MTLKTDVVPGWKRTLRKIGMVALVLLTIGSFAPLVLPLLAFLAADQFGCQTGAEPYPCLVGGNDWGEAINVSLMMGWLLVVSWPGMLVSVTIWLVLGIRRLDRRVRPSI